jgi:hypothetical protein
MLKILIIGLPCSISKIYLGKTFSKFGNVTSVKIKKNNKNDKEKMAFITFLEDFISEIKIDKVFYGIIAGKKIKIKRFKRISDISTKTTNLLNSNKEEKGLIKKKTNQPEGSLEIVNFHNSTTENDFKKLFGIFGYISNLYIKKNTNSLKNQKGVFVRYGIPECAIKAACFFEKKVFKGMVLRVKKINMIKNKHFISRDSKFKSFKNLQNDHGNQFFSYNKWTSLFINSENIFNKLKEKYGENKSYKNEKGSNSSDKNQILISQGRTRAESNLFLKKEGILIDIFSFLTFPKKSRHCFFLKYRFFQEESFNLDIFKKFGEIKNFHFIFLSKIIIVDYKKSQFALSAFKYFHDKFLFEKDILIDWIPLDFIKKKNAYPNIKLIHSKNSNTNCDNFKSSGFFRKNSLKTKLNQQILSKQVYFNGKTKIKSKSKQLQKFDFFLDNQIQTNHITYIGKLIVRNIPFKSKLCDLKKIFSIFGKILSIRVPKQKNGDNKGFAFIDYQTLNDAKKALFLIQNTTIASRNLKISLLK